MDCVVSVVVPVYNVENFIDKCVDSIVKQTYKNIQIILVDDGSTDSSGQLCDVWKNKDDRIQVIHQENGGLAHARNEGMKIVTGDYVLFVDSDDWIEKNMVEILLSNCLKYKADIGVCRYKRIYPDYTENNESGNSFCCTGEQALYYHIFEMSRPYDFCYAVWNKLYSYELIKNLRFPKGRNYEDIVFTSQALYSAQKVFYIDKGLYNYVALRKGSIMNEGFNVRKITDELSQMDDRIKYFDEMKLDIYKQEAICILINRIYQCCGYLLISKKVENKKIYLQFMKELHKKYTIHNKKNRKEKWKVKVFKISPYIIGWYYVLRMGLLKKGVNE